MSAHTAAIRLATSQRTVRARADHNFAPRWEEGGCWWGGFHLLVEPTGPRLGDIFGLDVAACQHWTEGKRA